MNTLTTESSKNWILIGLYLSISLLPGPITYLMYQVAVKGRLGAPLNFSLQSENVSIIIATFAFTMLGFMAAIITVLFAFVDTRVVKKYAKKDYFSTFFLTYFITIISLVMTFGFSLLTFASQGSVIFLKLSFVSLINNLVQITLITMTIVNLSRRAFEERSKG
ncbi:hypothetical protein [Halomonas sp. BC04]|uniref:hypothetical protein n=1 Tax=Halomonas sp. BC04 TaxID=1403540 RepID=UPI0003ED7DBC|nr:hypothetical protein [Halomonas sp. BC04]EWH03725.1 hypothetical protein Q427_01765 [Halomonas sp. BC04]